MAGKEQQSKSIDPVKRPGFWRKVDVRALFGSEREKGQVSNSQDANHVQAENEQRLVEEVYWKLGKSLGKVVSNLRRNNKETQVLADSAKGSAAETKEHLGTVGKLALATKKDRVATGRDMLKTAGLASQAKSAADRAGDVLKDIDAKKRQIGEIAATPGPKGEKGDTGLQGLQGPAGADGVQGLPGRDGANGATGPQGQEGPQGIQGPKGETGEKGPQGERGPAGADGIQGPQGVQGLKGDAGETGPQGSKGETGEKGDKGDPGIPGTNGTDGTNGADGKSAYQSAVDAGFKGDEAAWRVSLIGKQGNPGLKGETGPQGPRGPEWQGAGDLKKEISRWKKTTIGAGILGGVALATAVAALFLPTNPGDEKTEATPIPIVTPEKSDITINGGKLIFP